MGSGSTGSGSSGSDSTGSGTSGASNSTGSSGTGSSGSGSSASGTPTASGGQSTPTSSSDTGALGASDNSTMGAGDGKTMQVTVTGYQVCGTQAMDCGLTGAPGKDPTAAMSLYLMPNNKGNCGTCWKISNIRTLVDHGKGQLPTIGATFKSEAEGMVVMVNNACAPGADQTQPGAVGQCAQTTSKPKDGLGSASVLDLCSDTDAVQKFWGTTTAGMSVADVTGVDCSEWSGTIKKVGWNA